MSNTLPIALTRLSEQLSSNPRVVGSIATRNRESALLALSGVKGPCELWLAPSDPLCDICVG